MQLSRIQNNRLVLIGVILVGVMITLPLTALETVQQFLPSFQIQPFINSLVILLTTAIGVTVIGVGLAWLTSSHHFKGRKLLHWLVMLPLAVPPYLLAFSITGVFTANPLVMSSSYHGCLIALFYIFTLYPFVYIPVRHAISHRQRHYLDHCQMMGLTPAEVLFKLTLPKSYPALFAGLSIVLIETVADFATPALFGYPTLSTVLLDTQQTSTQLTALIAPIISLILLGILIQLGKLPFNKQKPDSADLEHIFIGYQLSGKAGMVAIGILFGVGLIGFILPALTFLIWGFSANVGEVQNQLGSWIGNSFLFASLVILLGSVVIVIYLSPRRFKLMAKISQSIFSISKAIPTTALAALVLIMMVLPFSLLGNSEINTSTISDKLLISSLFALLFVYLLHFIPSVLERVNLTLLLPSKLSQPIGLSKWSSFRYFLLPKLWPAIITLLIILTEVLRELPATYLLAPSSWETLAVACFDLVRNGMQADAALPALLIICIGILPIPLFSKYSVS